VRENRTHGSEGGDGESRLRPLSDLVGGQLAWIPAFAGMTEPWRVFVVHIIPHMYFRRRTRSTRSSECQFSETFVSFVNFVVRKYFVLPQKLFLGGKHAEDSFGFE